MTLKPLPTFGRFTVTSSIVITMNLEFNSMCRRKKHSSIPLKYIDVTRSTHTDLDVMQEKRVDDCWDVDSNRSLSDSWKGFTKFTLLKEKPPKRYMWSRGEIDKIQINYHYQIMCGQKYGRKLVKPLRIEKNKNGKTTSQNSTMFEDWGGIYFIDPDDQDYKETISKMRGENWKDPVAAAMPCKRRKAKKKLAPRRWNCEAGKCIPKDSKN